MSISSNLKDGLYILPKVIYTKHRGFHPCIKRQFKKEERDFLFDITNVQHMEASAFIV